MEMGIEPKVFKNDEVSLKKLENINFDRTIYLLDQEIPTMQAYL
jgi:hypothetical protein